MTKFLAQTDLAKSLIGVVAAVLMGGTLMLAATAPALSPAPVAFAANSDIVGVA